ncbi:NHLP leader peptide family RiPP precursor [Paenibacillus sp. LHD-117]|uniref:NHLP leader peptide family RiPP precursor n=1 Tax=Paenibacillus sp. LHD-117 TaxID=3071412 RepID=UPI0027E0A649|nr:NHLP leader peptide family RiPP precursor [Paenibacillus sp. LHD-117]MDQ6420062.1 NHLP leader peptide family RiPP precursor [Paenibacillus sp. LHD-117]
MSSTQDLKDQIIEKAWTDAEFKKQLLADPKSAIRDAFGVDIPDDISIEVLEDTDSKYHLVLPQNPADAPVNEVGAPRWT